MNRREKLMALALLLLLVMWGGRTLYGRYSDSVARSETELQTARERLAAVNMSLAQGRRAIRQLEGWQEMSLPTNRDVARSLYRAWLSQKASAAGLRVEDINPNERTTASTAFRSVGYTIQAKGTLAAVTKFLYEFYRSAQLHQITKLNLISTPGAAELGVELQIEALILPGAKHQNELPGGQTDRLKLASAEEYEMQITGRDLFKVYTPPRPPRPPVARTTRPTPPKFDDASQAYVTGIVQIGPRLQAWITIRTTGEVLRLYEGDDVKVGALEGKIESISPRMVVVKTDADKPLRVQLGRSLREPDETESKDDPASKPAAESSDT